MIASKPRKQSIALYIRPDESSTQTLLVLRPDDDAEFAGMWGLPAASCRPGETPEQAVQRIGAQKLGIAVEQVRAVSRGRQERPDYVLEMTLFEARVSGGAPRLPASPDSDGVTLYSEWRWGSPIEVKISANNGSLCSQLLLESLGLAQNPLESAHHAHTDYPPHTPFP